MSGALAGIKVIEAASYVTGPFASQLLAEKDLPAAPINTLDEVFADPQVKAYGFPVEIEHPKMGKMKLIGNAVDMGRTPPSIETPPPVLGEHTDEILGALGYDRARDFQTSRQRSDLKELE